MNDELPHELHDPAEIDSPPTEISHLSAIKSLLKRHKWASKIAAVVVLLLIVIVFIVIKTGGTSHAVKTGTTCTNTGSTIRQGSNKTLTCVNSSGKLTWQDVNTSVKQTSSATAPNENMLWSGGRCTGSGSVQLTSSPLPVASINSIAPMGNMTGAHVTPSDHLGFSPKGTSPVNVSAPANGYIVGLDYNSTEKWYGATIEHSCTFYSRVYLMTTLSANLKQYLHGVSSSVRIPVTAGEVVGTVQSHGIDFWVANLNTSQKFINPSRYSGEAWKIYDVNPFDYFTEPLKSQLAPLDIRQTAPLGGQIDYDVPGTMAGNWFESGVTESQNNEQLNAPYELSLAEDWIDPTLNIASIGKYDGQPAQFAISTSSPDPKDVTVKNGLVKFGLVSFAYKLPNGQQWDMVEPQTGLTGYTVESAVHGTLLAQLQSDGTLKIETFNGKTPSQVVDFDSAAVTYER